MPILKAQHPGCCASVIYYDFGNAHQKEVYYNLEDFAIAMINAGSPNSYNLAWLNGEQTAEIGYLKELGWEVIHESGSRFGSKMTLMLGLYANFEAKLAPYRVILLNRRHE